MKSILVTQRLEEHRGQPDLRIDPNWFQFISTLGAYCQPVGWFDCYKLPHFGLDVCGVVLTGGGDIAAVDQSDCSKKRDMFEIELLQECVRVGLPVLGVCRGMQLINHHYGGSLKRVAGHVRSQHSLDIRPKYGLECFMSCEVNSYHEYAVKDIGQGLESVAKTTDGCIEAVISPSEKVLGIMWHPERTQPTPDGHVNFYKNFFGLTACA